MLLFLLGISSIILSVLLSLSYNNTDNSKFIEICIWTFGIPIVCFIILFTIFLRSLGGRCPPG